MEKYELNTKNLIRIKVYSFNFNIFFKFSINIKNLNIKN